MGFWSRKSAKGSSGFFLAGRQLGALATTSTLAATTIGGSATILVIGQVYSNGLPFIWTDIAGGLGLIALGFLLAGKVRKMGCYSLPEIIGKFYGEKVRRISAVIVVIAQTGFLALLLRASVSLLIPYLHLPEMAVLLIVAGIFILYTILGGQMAVVRTDVVQVILMALALALVLIPLFMSGVNLEQIPEENLHFPFNSNFGFSTLAGLFLISGLPHLVGSDIFGKLLSSKNPDVAKKSSIYAGIIKIAVGIIVGLIGLLASGIILNSPPDQVLSKLLMSILPTEVALIVIFGFIATLMSSADSVLLTAGTVITRDILRVSEEKSVLSGRLSILITGSLAIALTLYFPTILGAFLLPTLFSAALWLFLSWQASGRKTWDQHCGAAISMVASASVVIIFTFLNYGNEIVTLSGLLTCSILLFAISRLAKKN